ncbi:probable basic-leucine zipper transcription factor K [Nilaparvata lugens]|uniref:probable basic-leucine zipper transcription factor K n=1 Tax=Nilaparvata lugens TaxID=108931 RepID=UPI00193D1C9F|nr:probable basic-leucine zipper transcription factor K [Nilaparvata lugens]
MNNKIEEVPQQHEQQQDNPDLHEELQNFHELQEEIEEVPQQHEQQQDNPDLHEELQNFHELQEEIEEVPQQHEQQQDNPDLHEELQNFHELQEEIEEVPQQHEQQQDNPDLHEELQETLPNIAQDEGVRASNSVPASPQIAPSVAEGTENAATQSPSDMTSQPPPAATNLEKRNITLDSSVGCVTNHLMNDSSSEFKLMINQAMAELMKEIKASQDKGEENTKIIQKDVKAVQGSVEKMEEKVEGKFSEFKEEMKNMIDIKIDTQSTIIKKLETRIDDVTCQVNERLDDVPKEVKKQVDVLGKELGTTIMGTVMEQVLENKGKIESKVEENNNKIAKIVKEQSNVQTGIANLAEEGAKSRERYSMLENAIGGQQLKLTGLNDSPKILLLEEQKPTPKTAAHHEIKTPRKHQPLLGILFPTEEPSPQEELPATEEQPGYSEGIM